MDFTELESMEGLRWAWNSWPESSSFDPVIPLSVLHTPLLGQSDVPVLPYAPLRCSACNSILNPYARVVHASAFYACAFCDHHNPFPISHADHNLPPELFPSHTTVEYCGGLDLGLGLGFGFGFVFVVDLGIGEEQMGGLKSQILRVVAGMPETAMVGIVSFGDMVFVHDLGFQACSRVVALRGDVELDVDKMIEFLRVSSSARQRFGTSPSIRKQGFLQPISECDFNFTMAIEELRCSSPAVPGRRLRRATGAAISASIAILEGFLPVAGGRIMVFTSGPATTGPGMIVETDLSKPIRTHRDLINDRSCRT